MNFTDFNKRFTENVVFSHFFNAFHRIFCYQLPKNVNITLLKVPKLLIIATYENKITSRILLCLFVFSIGNSQSSKVKIKVKWKEISYNYKVETIQCCQ